MEDNNTFTNTVTMSLDKYESLKAEIEDLHEEIENSNNKNLSKKEFFSTIFNALKKNMTSDELEQLLEIKAPAVSFKKINNPGSFSSTLLIDVTYPEFNGGASNYDK